MASGSSSAEKQEYIAGPLAVKYDDHEQSIDIQLVIPGIKRPGIFSKGNTDVDAKFEDQSMRLLFSIYDKKKSKEGVDKPKDKRLFEVKRLPGKVLTDLCHYRLKDDRCIVVLHKAVPGSWENALCQHGLDISGGYSDEGAMFTVVDDALTAYAKARRLTDQSSLTDMPAVPSSHAPSANSKDLLASDTSSSGVFSSWTSPSRKPNSPRWLFPDPNRNSNEELVSQFTDLIEKIEYDRCEMNSTVAAIASVLVQQRKIPADTLLAKMNDGQKEALNSVSCHSMSIPRSAWRYVESRLPHVAHELWQVIGETFKVCDVSAIEEVEVDVQDPCSSTTCPSVRWQSLDIDHCYYYKINNIPGSLISASVSDCGSYISSGMEDSSLNMWRVSQDVAPLNSGQARNLIVKFPFSADPQNFPSKSLRSEYHSVIRGHSGPVYDLKFLPANSQTTSKMLLSCSYDSTARLFDLEKSGANVVAYDGGEQPLFSLDISAEGQRFVTGGLDMQARYFDLERRFPLRILIGHDDSVDCVKFHPTGDVLATASGSDRSLIVWQVDNAKPLRKLTGFKSGFGPDAMCFSEDGKLLVCVGEDRRLYIWDLDAGKQWIEPIDDWLADRCLGLQSFAGFLISSSAGGVIRVDRLDASLEQAPSKVFKTPKKTAVLAARYLDCGQLHAVGADLT